MAGTYMDPRTAPFMDEETVDRQRRNRLQQLHELWQAYPGRAHGDFPQPAGLKWSDYRSGLTSNDAAGYAQMLAEQQEEVKLRTGRPTQYRYDPRPEQQKSASIADSPDWWLQGEPDPREVTAQTIPRIRRNLDKMPASLRALYAERFRQR
mgnify:CR=1 FL=1